MQNIARPASPLITAFTFDVDTFHSVTFSPSAAASSRPSGEKTGSPNNSAPLLWTVECSCIFSTFHILRLLSRSASDGPSASTATNLPSGEKARRVMPYPFGQGWMAIFTLPDVQSQNLTVPSG